jgi:signal transduction histidine kinase
MTDNIYFLIVVGMLGVFLILAFMIMLQVKNQNRLLYQQQKMTEAEIAHQKNLLQAVITSQETERQRIGADLHDEVGSVLSSLRLLIEKHTQTAQPAGEDQLFNRQSKQLIDRVITKVRHISHNLSPRISGSFGFFDAVHELADTVNQSATLHLTLEFDEGTASHPMNENTAMAVYRVLAELINNTIKHAQAANIQILVAVSKDSMKISYSDDGIGFTYDPNGAGRGMGMQNIESRLDMVNAKWELPKNTEKGFAMEITVPLI